MKPPDLVNREASDFEPKKIVEFHLGKDIEVIVIRQKICQKIKRLPIVYQHLEAPQKKSLIRRL